MGDVVKFKKQGKGIKTYGVKHDIYYDGEY